ncbi:uncharacterized protein EI90DRAFT_3075863 [Cantharellus anzutake]|uniref:uncharacterized protein n=1 Tax=Cantharellus anzutake TaxID=1750568 RepID=UPI0019043805|nr:uncharacterized protein EI90DRAFT_3075863 [Cantharellus anzutake]KAF8324325.1 hypothetical protein EI90DRAFT_3075863 [Cantharellus anzutake]
MSVNKEHPRTNTRTPEAMTGRGQRRAMAIQSGLIPPNVQNDRKVPEPDVVQDAAIDSEMRSRAVTKQEQKDLTHHPDTLYDEEIAAFFFTHMGNPIPSVDELKAYKKPTQVPSKETLLLRAATAKAERQEALNTLFDLQVMQSQRLDSDQILSEEFLGARPQDLDWFKKQHDHLQHRQTDTWSALRELQRIIELPIYQKMEDTTRQAEPSQQRLRSALPTTREDFDSMDEGPRYKVARWLTLNRPINARSPEWTPEAQATLWQLYINDKDFRTHVEVFVESKKTIDPRRR